MATEVAEPVIDAAEPVIDVAEPVIDAVEPVIEASRTPPPLPTPMNAATVRLLPPPTAYVAVC